MIEVCMLSLNEGKAKDWQESLKYKVTQKFIQDSTELQHVIDSKQGFWSSVKGFGYYMMECSYYSHDNRFCDQLTVTVFESKVS